MINHIVLLEPEIPQNTGNIARTCAATTTHLHLIHPLGFSTDDKYLKRAGMDYWSDVKVIHYSNWKDFIDKNSHYFKSDKLFFLTTKAKQSYHTKSYKNKNCWFVFGKESGGIPEEILLNHPNESIRIPMEENSRSLNLSNCAAIILYEALRQQDFQLLVKEGTLHHNKW